MNFRNGLINYLKSIYLIIILTTIILSAHKLRAESTLEVVYCPDSIRFGESQPIESSSIADFLSLSLGYTLPKPFNWKGINAITNVLSLPKASLTLRIAGHYDITNSINKFPIFETKDMDNQFDILSKRTHKRFIDQNLFLVKIDLPQEDLSDNGINGNELLLRHLPITSNERFSEALKDNELKQFVSSENLDVNDPNIKLFITEIGTIKQLLTALKNVKNSNIDSNSWPIRAIFWIEIRGLKQIVDNNNYNNNVKSKARLLITNLLQELTKELRSLYDNKIIITVIEDDQMPDALVRRTRYLFANENKLSENKLNANNTILNLAHDYDPDFHTSFAMLAFTTILIALIVFGVSVAMWNMDPGRDSIIYRMTSQRMKKEQ
jgi:renin receptor